MAAVEIDAPYAARYCHNLHCEGRPSRRAGRLAGTGPRSGSSIMGNAVGDHAGLETHDSIVDGENYRWLLATNFSVSQSLQDEAISLGIAAPEKIVVLVHGSSNGVLADDFRQTPEVKAKAAELRSPVEHSP